MTTLEHDDFMKKYQIEFPAPSELTVLHAEPVSLIKEQGYTFSDDALDMIDELVIYSGLRGVEFNKWIASGTGPMHHILLFFLDRTYHMAQHVLAIRDTWDEITMTSYLGPNAHKSAPKNPPPVGLLYVADVPTLHCLADRSPFLGLLLPIADGPPDDVIWSYFLGKAAQNDIEYSEDVEAPITLSSDDELV